MYKSVIVLAKISDAFANVSLSVGWGCIVKLISSILSDHNDDDDCESDGHEDFDYLEEKNETIPVGLMIQDMFSDHWTKEYAWQYRLLHYENLAEGREEETEDDDTEDYDTEDDHSDDDYIDQRYALLIAPFLSQLD